MTNIIIIEAEEHMINWGALSDEVQSIVKDCDDVMVFAQEMTFYKENKMIASASIFHVDGKVEIENFFTKDGELWCMYQAEEVADNALRIIYLDKEVRKYSTLYNQMKFDEESAKYYKEMLHRKQQELRSLKPIGKYWEAIECKLLRHGYALVGNDLIADAVTEVMHHDVLCNYVRLVTKHDALQMKITLDDFPQYTYS